MNTGESVGGEGTGERNVGSSVFRERIETSHSKVGVKVFEHWNPQAHARAESAPGHWVSVNTHSIHQKVVLE